MERAAAKVQHLLLPLLPALLLLRLTVLLAAGLVAVAGHVAAAPLLPALSLPLLRPLAVALGRTVELLLLLLLPASLALRLAFVAAGE